AWPDTHPQPLPCAATCRAWSCSWSGSACPRGLPSFPTRRSSDLQGRHVQRARRGGDAGEPGRVEGDASSFGGREQSLGRYTSGRSEEHTSELQSRFDLVCRLLLEKKKYSVDADIITRVICNIGGA